MQGGTAVQMSASASVVGLADARRRVRTLRRRTPALLLTVAAVAAIVASATLAAGETPLARRITKAVRRYEAASGAVVGVCIVRLAGGGTIVQLRPDELFIPASNQKLLTSAFALTRLGGDFQFATAAYLDNGHLRVFGSGDPTFGDPVLAKDANRTIYAELDRWADAIKRADPAGVTRGITCYASFTVDQRTALKAYRHPTWPVKQRERHYCAPVAGLNLSNNCFNVTFRRNGGGAILPVVVPASRHIRVVNRTKLGRRHVWSLRTNVDDSELTVRGTVKSASSSPYPVAANDPPLLFARVLADRLARAKVPLAGRIRAGALPTPANRPKGKPVARTLTPLADVLRRMNKASLNMAAECVLLRAGDGTWAGSAKLMADTLAKTYRLDPAGLVVSDGGGLSRDNRVSPATMVRVLAGAAARSDARGLLQSLPSSGTDGTLRKRLARAPYKTRVRAKTGYVMGVCTLSGFVLNTQRQGEIAFSILANRVPPGKAWQAKQLQDTICRMLVDELDRK